MKSCITHRPPNRLPVPPPPDDSGSVLSGRNSIRSPTACDSSRHHVREVVQPFLAVRSLMSMNRSNRFASLRIVMVILAALHPAAPSAADQPASRVAGSLSRRAFERIRSLRGRWKDVSTKGWTESTDFNLIARDSVVLETSRFTDTGEGMASTFSLDGDRLLLTHYCEARNQPRLIATAISEDGSDIRFTFKDATNLANRNVWHMGSSRRLLARDACLWPDTPPPSLRLREPKGFRRDRDGYRQGGSEVVLWQEFYPSHQTTLRMARSQSPE